MPGQSTVNGLRHSCDVSNTCPVLHLIALSGKSIGWQTETTWFWLTIQPVPVDLQTFHPEFGNISELSSLEPVLEQDPDAFIIFKKSCFFPLFDLCHHYSVS